MGSGSFKIQVRVQPRAIRDEVRFEEGGTLNVRINAPPVKGAANKRLISLIARRLGIAGSQIVIHSGAGSRNKIIEIQGVHEKPDDLLKRLKESHKT